MQSFEASADIAAPPADVWRILANTPGWTNWDSGILEVDGTADLGSTLRIRSAAAPKRVFPVRVSTVKAPSLLEFTGGMPLGLFRGVRRYTLTPQDAGTKFTMREEYTGAMLPLIWPSMPDLQPSFEQFARGLKSEAEPGESETHLDG